MDETTQQINLEADRIFAETRKLQAETGKLEAERGKLEAERGKFARETFWYPVFTGAGLAAGLMTAGAALAVAFVKLFAGHA